eukprot:287928_1
MTVSFIVFLVLINGYNCKPNYCLPTDTDCWPTSSEISDFNSLLNGELFQPSDTDQTNYETYINMTQDLLYRNQYPEFIIVCSDVKDIQNSVLFASKHNIQISIMSTGHSYSGRNTANNSLQIVLSKMRNFKINTNANGDKESITVETGLNLGTIYQLIAPGIVIGPDDPSVGPGGSSLRGGHSPIGPAFGLASDFTLEYYMVDANANIIRVYNTSGKNQTIDDLFWSLKGGGGSTFGVIVNITFLIHKQETNNVFTCFSCTYTFYINPISKQNYIGDVIWNNLFQLIQNGTLDQHWGGYIISLLGTQSITIDMFFYGDSSYAMKNAEPIFHLQDPYPTPDTACGNFTIYETFQEFQLQFGADTGGGYAKIWNDLIPKQNLTTEYTDTLCAFFNSSHELSPGYYHVLCGIFQGGKINEFSDDYTSVSPGFRHNQFEITLGGAWSDVNKTNEAVQHCDTWEQKFRKFGYGKYSNEENRSCGEGCDWKQLFYGTNYDRLVKVKQIWDPKQIFWCNHCVGSDL